MYNVLVCDDAEAGWDPGNVKDPREEEYADHNPVGKI